MKKNILFQIAGFKVPKYLNWKLSDILKSLFIDDSAYRIMRGVVEGPPLHQGEHEPRNEAVAGRYGVLNRAQI